MREGVLARSIAAGVCDTVHGWIWYCDQHDTHGNSDSEAEAAYMLDAHAEFFDDEECTLAGLVARRADEVERPESPADRSEPPLGRLLRTPAAMEYAQKSRSQLYRLAGSALLTRYRVGHQTYWDISELDGLVQAIRRDSQQVP